MVVPSAQNDSDSAVVALCRTRHSLYMAFWSVAFSQSADHFAFYRDMIIMASSHPPLYLSCPSAAHLRIVIRESPDGFPIRPMEINQCDETTTSAPESPWPPAW